VPLSKTKASTSTNYRLLTKILQAVFQFQYDAIGGDETISGVLGKNIFQFQYGAIGGYKLPIFSTNHKYIRL